MFIQEENPGQTNPNQPQENSQQQAPEQPVPQNQQSQGEQKPTQQQNPATESNMFKLVKTTQEERIWAALGYILILGVLTLTIKPKSEFCRKHATQGLVIFIAWFITLIAMAIIPFLSVLFLVFMGIGLVGIIMSVQSKEFNLPVLKDVAKMIPVNVIFGKMTGKEAPQETNKDNKEEAEPENIINQEQEPKQHGNQQEMPQEPAEKQPQKPAQPSQQPENPQEQKQDGQKPPQV